MILRTKDDTRASLAKPAFGGKLAVIGLLVLAQQIPNNLLATLVPAVFREIGVPLEQFWLISVAGLPIWLKWVWGPIVDRTGSERFGYRKTWLLPATILSTLTYVAIGFVNPTIGLIGWLIFLMTLKTVVYSVQDVAVDGYTVENLGEGERAPGAVVIRLATFATLILVNGALLPLYDVYGWQVVMIGAGLSMTALTLPALLRKEPAMSKEKQERLKQARETPILAFSIECFRRFVLRRQSFFVVPALILVGLMEGYIVGLTPAFLVDQGLSITEVGMTLVAGSVFGGILGGLLGSKLINVLGLQRMALYSPVLLLLVVIPTYVLTLIPEVTLAMSATAISLQMFGSMPLLVMMDTARLRWASKEQAGTDYSIMSALYNGGRMLGVGVGGLVAGTFGYGVFFLAAIPIGLIAMAIFYVGLSWIARNANQTQERSEAGSVTVG